MSDAPHIPVLINAILDACAPIHGTWLDGTFGAGGYTRRLLDAGAERVIAVDRDPLAFEMAQDWIGDYGDRIVPVAGTFSKLDEYAQNLDGVVLDLGVSSMQLDLAERGFSFMRDGPLDMRMSQSGFSAADLVNMKDEAEIADIIYLYGEERASRRIAKAIVAARPVTTTAQLARIVESCLPRPKPNQSHPATRTFQALRIAVNDEYGELATGMEAAERALAPGGQLAVVTFHSVEDRMAKRFIQTRSATTPNANRYAPVLDTVVPAFTQKTRKAIVADKDEVAMNPRSRSAKLRVAIRTDAPAQPMDRKDMGMPMMKGDAQ
ncbi:MAG: 16S rRNA (cytosine(1402)-N(4))-methyltransferase RsmH [Alphaproteobacteria bacterium]|jgi:16S rRNA (cytosine1402-N4)-methyltransferase|uniref:Ribosomal RNA small subunit methyltransferase H n=1 Tax=Loktanella salsilacus TaxID=195913 RepID=A0A1I4BYN5_9RHOB|nr:16S rRNA (cytosine(1402)-N(4))-methyltransferase RsmH [Loktanella salsilacus]MBU0782106.1 16S rRNA (cytosine(1402)-N(4))-methyltransferase RsmH [Alphaproteobacteria bacterium]MBU0861160.1 16S rRNA (cytosine(1402)-N(4))-methyltransferase RsmH [Alphaproteobacteria bacterium]MBU1838099.1 16S rRNA (cytosine(1402)-N(4))-methyltransferase RsmH [Alphaproteobacteria bacterium]UTH45381.1 16S rRNA (cytosine(1402)-N(4))-methyltransferase RsmH [Loktanella salsilacus]UTH49145.1 16S rRNA (cytosine(1402)-|tara:strand:- start:929 stop:1894 length:966 start_codon:yes stop_codon:yes gene_type:complete